MKMNMGKGTKLVGGEDKANGEVEDPHVQISGVITLHHSLV